MIIAAMIAASHQRPNSRNTMMLAETSVEFRCMSAVDNSDNQVPEVTLQ